MPEPVSAEQQRQLLVAIDDLENNPKFVANLERVNNPDQPGVANLIEAAGECGISTEENQLLAKFARFDAWRMEDQILSYEAEIEEYTDLAKNFKDQGKHLQADWLKAQVDEANQRLAVLKQIHQAEVNGQPLSKAELYENLQGLKAAADNAENAVRHLEKEARLLFQAELTAAIGPELAEMGYSAQEQAVIIKALSDYALEQDEIEPTVENAEKVAAKALKNLHSSDFVHQQPGLNESDQRIHDVARRCLGMKNVQLPNGSVSVERPGERNDLDDSALNDLIEEAKEHVDEHGVHAVIGDGAVRAGQQVKQKLNDRSPAPVVQQAPRPRMPNQAPPRAALLPPVLGNVAARQGGELSALLRDVRRSSRDLTPQQNSQLMQAAQTVRGVSQSDVEAMQKAQLRPDVIAALGKQNSNEARAGMNSPSHPMVREELAKNTREAINKAQNMQHKKSNREALQAHQHNQQPAQDQKQNYSHKHGY